MSQPTVTQAILATLTAYDAIIRDNDAGDGKVIAAVATDDTGEVHFEVLDTAETLGYELLFSRFDNFRLLRIAIVNYKVMLAGEIESTKSN